MKRKIAFLTILNVLLFLVGCGKYGYDFKDGWQNGDQEGIDPIDSSLTFIDRSKYDKARIFPGLVGSNVHRAQDTTVALNLAFRNITSFTYKVHSAPEPIFSVGLYAPAGENVKIEVPTGVDGLLIQIGSHTTSLEKEPILNRDPYITTSQNLYPGTNYVRNPYGGLIWIHARVSISNPVNLKFSNVVRTSDYIQGKGTQEAWLSDVEKNDVPWLEIRSERVVFTVPRSLVLQYKNEINLEAALANWKEIYEEDFYKVMGLTPNNPDLKNSFPDLPERGVLDIQLRRPYYSTGGTPWAAYTDKYWFNLMTSSKDLLQGSIRESWELYHTLGHNYQMFTGWSWGSLSEVTNNLFVFKAANRVGISETSVSDEVKRLITKSLTFAARNSAKNFNQGFGDGEDAYHRLAPFLQIFEKVQGKNGESGWEFFTYLYIHARNSNFFFGLDEAKMDYFYRSLCEFGGKDYARFMHAWGIPISHLAQKEMRKLYPPLEVALWEYNPITKTGGMRALTPKYDLVGNDFSWSSNMLTAKSESLGNFAALSDGLSSTYWHTCSDNCAIQTQASVSNPTNLDLDMKSLKEVAGVYLQNRQDRTFRRGATVYTRESENGVWINRGSIVMAQNSSDPTRADRKEFKFEEIVSARYIRFSFTEHEFDNSPHTAIAEAGAFYDPN